MGFGEAFVPQFNLEETECSGVGQFGPAPHFLWNIVKLIRRP